MGVDPAAKGAVHHDSDLSFISESRTSTDICETDDSVDELWDEVANMVDCPTPRQSDYFDVGDANFGRKTGTLRRGAGMHSSRQRTLKRSETKMVGQLRVEKKFES